MPHYRFELVLAPLAGEFDGDLCNAVWEACGEVEFEQIAGVPRIAFDRQAKSLEAAVAAASADTRRAGLTPVRIELAIESIPAA